MKTIKYLNLEMVAIAPVECDLNVGDEVIFTNEYGVSFHGLRVIGFDNSVENGRFIHLNTDCYWFPVNRQSIQKMSYQAQMALLNRTKAYVDMPYLLKSAYEHPLIANINGYHIVFNNVHNHFSLSHDEIGVIDHNSDFHYLCECALKG